MATYNGVVILDVSWSSLKNFATSKNLAVQYEQSDTAYEIFCLDGNIGYKTVIFTGPVPNTVDFNQSTNDADKSDFETNYKDIVTNRVVTPSATVDGYAITTANPTLIAGSDGSFIRTLRSDTSGRLVTVGLGTAGTPDGGVVSIQGVSGGQPIPISGTISASPSTDVVATGTIAANGVSVVTAAINSLSTAIIQITGTWVGTIQFEGTTNGTTYVAINARNANSGTISTSTTSNNIFRTSISGFQIIRCRSSAWTSGTATITIRQSYGNSVTYMSESLPTGSNTIGAVTISGTPTVTVTSSDTNATSTFNALNAAATVTIADKTSVGFRLTAGTLIGTIVAEISLDGGTTWTSTLFDDLSTGVKESSIVFSSNNATIQKTIVLAGGASNARVRVSAFTSGTASANIRATKSNDPSLLFTGNNGGTLPLTVGQMGGSDGTNLRSLRVPSDGTVRIDPTGTTIQPISAVSLPLPTDAATETTLTTLLSESTFTTRINTLGQNTMTNSTPVVLASDQSAIPVTQSGTWTVQPGNTANTTPWLTTISQGGNAATVSVAGALKIDGSAVTQPVSGTITANQGGTWNINNISGTISLPTGAATETTLSTRLADSTFTGRINTLGQKTMANSTPVVISSDQSALTVTGTVTATNPSVSTTGSTPPASATYIGGSVTTAAPTYTTGQMSALSLTTGGLLRVDNSSVTQPISGTITANAGTGNFTVVQATASNLNATVVQSTAANLRSQTASEATTAAATGTVASLTGGAVTTAAPTYTTGQMNPLSLTTSGALRIDGSGATQPVSGTVTANAGTGTFTVSGTVAATQSGTWTVQPGNTANTTPWLATINQGGNSAAVKAASTAAIATDPALVVAISPNNTLNINQQDTSVSGNLTALNSTVSITTSGKYTIGGTIAGTWVGSIVAEGTVDGTNWFTVRTANKSTNDIINTYTINDSFEFYSVAGCTQVRLRMSAYTSGTATVSFAGTSLATDAFLNYSGTDNDVAPPLRHVSIATLGNDGFLHVPRNTNVDPTGTEYALVTRSLEYALSTTGYQPATNLIPDAPVSITTDASGRLEIHGSVTTDETSFRTDFTGSSITTNLTGTLNFTNGSNSITGVGTIFSSEFHTGDYIKKTADANTLWVQVSEILSDTEIIVTTNYAGTTASGVTGVTSNFNLSIGTGGSIAVSGSNLTLGSGTTANSSTYIVRKGDYGPVTLRILASLSQRIANNSFRIGLQDTVDLTPNNSAVIQFTGTNNTQVTCISSSSSAVADTQTTTVTLPVSLLTSPPTLEFKIDVSANQVSFGVTDPVTRIYYPLAQHNTHIPGPYDSMDIVALSVNGAGAPASNTNLVIDMIYFQNVDRLQIDDDFSLEPIRVQIVSGKSNLPLTYSAASGPFTPASSPTDVFTITGSATKTIRVTRIAFTMNQTTSSARDVLVIKRSTANSGGTSTLLNNVPVDSQNAAATATVRSYTTNPTLGTSVGTIRSRKVFVATLTGNNSNSDEVLLEFGSRTDTQNLVLRGTNEVLSINLNGVTSTGNSASCSVEWIEE